MRYVVFCRVSFSIVPAVCQASVTEAKEDKGIVFWFVCLRLILGVLFTP